MKPLHTFDTGEDNVFHLYGADTQPDAFGRFAPLVALWQAKREDRRFPAWKDFDFEELHPWIGKMSLIDLDPGVVDGVYRLFGGDWVTVLGKDLTGKRYSKVIPKAARARSRPYLTTHLKDGLIGHRLTSSYWHHRDFIKVEVLELLLSDNGADATQNFSIVIRAKD